VRVKAIDRKAEQGALHRLELRGGARQRNELTGTYRREISRVREEDEPAASILVETYLAQGRSRSNQRRGVSDPEFRWTTLRDGAWREMHQRKLETSASFCLRKARGKHSFSEYLGSEPPGTCAQSQLRTFGTKLKQAPRLSKSEPIEPAVSSPYA
jgi:hypothetical protein